jgi:hypothetical protein
MPRTVSNYANSTIYKLCCNDPAVSDVYVGSTTNFRIRKNSHKKDCSNTSSKSYNYYVYQFIRENGGWNAWSMVQVEAYNATTKRDLETRERYWLETLGATLNRKVPTRTHQEYREENKERYKNYREENKETEKERQKKWRDENRDKVKKWREENREKINATQRKCRAKQFAMKLHEFIHS